MPTSYIRRGAALRPGQTGHADASPLYVNSASGTVKVVPASTGSTEHELLDADTAQTATNKTLTSPVINTPTITAPAITAPVRQTVAVPGGTLALTNAAHAGRTMLLSALAGCAVTLPAATGSGDVYRLERSVAATSVGDSFAVANNADYMRGVVHVVAKDDALLSQFGTLNTGTVATESDTATWNFTTTGICDIGDYIEFTDLAAHVWGVQGFYTVNGAEATPFSAAV